MISLDDLKVFIEVYNLDSYKLAAAKLKMSPPTVSRKIKQIEDFYGQELFFVKDNKLNKTSFANKLYFCSHECVNDLSNSLNKLLTNETKLDFFGTVRIQLPVGSSLHTLSRGLPKFIRQNMNINLEIIYSNNEYDIVRNQIDVCLLTRAPIVNSSEEYRKIAESKRMHLYCTREYAANFGLPNTPNDLKNHLLIGYINDNFEYSKIVKLTNSATQEFICVEMPNRLKTSSSMHNYKLVLSNDLIAPILADTAEYETEINQELIKVLPEWYIAPFNLYLFTNKYGDQDNIKLVSDFIEISLRDHS